VTPDGKPAPPRVGGNEEYWSEPPPKRSARCQWWVDRIRAGWRPSGRINRMGYYGSSEYYGVYIWEYLHVISPLLSSLEANPSPAPADADKVKR
jgi:hypothetical protein